MGQLLPNVNHIPTGFAFALRSLIIYDPPADSRFLTEASFLASPILTVLHLSSPTAKGAINSSDAIRSFVYPQQLRGFANPNSASYNKPASRIAYTRTLKLLRDTLGPKFDLEKVLLNLSNGADGRYGTNIAYTSS